MKTTRIVSAVSLFLGAALIGIAPTVSSAQEYPADEVIIDSPRVYPQDSVIDSAPGSPLYENELERQQELEEMQMEQMEEMESAPGSRMSEDALEEKQEMQKEQLEEKHEMQKEQLESAPGSPLSEDALEEKHEMQKEQLEQRHEMQKEQLESAPGAPLSEDELEETGYETYQSDTSRDRAAGSSAGAMSDRTGTNYLVLKGGVYSPSDGDLSDIDFGDNNGFAGEVAVGRYLLPFMALEVGAGYFQSKDSPALPAGSNTMLRVVPLVATAKALLPLGVFELYGLFGIGAYIADVDVRNDDVDFDGDTEVAFGLHAGAGFNINFSDVTFLGLEGKYLWAEPEFGGRDIELDGYITTFNVGFRF